MAGHYLIAASTSAGAYTDPIGTTSETTVVRAWDSQREVDVDLVLLPSVTQPLDRADVLRSLRTVLRYPHPRVATAIDSGVRGLRPFVVLPATSAAEDRLDRCSASDALAVVRQVAQGLMVLVEQGLSWVPVSRNHLRLDEEGGAQVIALTPHPSRCADEPAALLELGALTQALVSRYEAAAAGHDPDQQVQWQWLRGVSERLAGTAEPVINTVQECVEELAAHQAHRTQPGLRTPAATEQFATQSGVPEPSRLAPPLVQAPFSTAPLPVVKPAAVHLRGGAVDPGFAPRVVRLSTLVASQQKGYVHLDSLMRDYDPDVDEPPTMAIRTSKRGWRRKLTSHGGH